MLSIRKILGLFQSYTLSEIFERLIENQVKTYANAFLKPILCGFRESYSAQYALLSFVEKLEDKMSKGAVFIGLSKAFDCLNHELLIAKLEACGFLE